MADQNAVEKSINHPQTKVAAAMSAGAAQTPLREKTPKDQIVSDQSIPGFGIIFTRLSDGIGREPAVIIAYVLFAAFSLGGGLARTLSQLIVLRALQGIGGSGLYSMLMVIGTEVTPVQYFGALSAMIGTVLAIGSVLGIYLP
ncbi:MAG: hypothetical protein Q9163_001489 [Psora crenata]